MPAPPCSAGFWSAPRKGAGAAAHPGGCVYLHCRWGVQASPSPATSPAMPSLAACTAGVAKIAGMGGQITQHRFCQSGGRDHLLGRIQHVFDIGRIGGDLRAPSARNSLRWQVRASKRSGSGIRDRSRARSGRAGCGRPARPDRNDHQRAVTAAKAVARAPSAPRASALRVSQPRMFRPSAVRGGAMDAAADLAHGVDVQHHHLAPGIKPGQRFRRPWWSAFCRRTGRR